MPKTLNESAITTRAARSGLSSGVYWRSLDPDSHIGYRRGKRGGRWLVRYYDGKGNYRQLTIGTADDVISIGTLSYDQACRQARNAIVAARQVALIRSSGPIQTVGSAVCTYIDRSNARIAGREGRPTKSTSDSRLRLHVLSNVELAATPLHLLTEETLKSWRLGLNGKMTTRKRITSDFKAALNAAADSGAKILPAGLSSVIKRGLVTPDDEGDEFYSAATSANQILSDKEVRWIVQASKQVDEQYSWDGDLYRMVLVLAATGARFSQVRRLRVQDFQFIASRIMMPSSAKGRKRLAKYTPIPLGGDVLEALQSVINGRDKYAPLLEKWHHVRSGQRTWKRAKRRGWVGSYELTDAFQKISELAGLSGRTAYCLRHSSIVRHLRVGTPIRLVAALHDTSVEMIERHYSHWIADGLEEIAARAVVPLVSLYSDR
jgi:integrase